MEISQARISSGVGVRPTPYGDDCASATPPCSNTNGRSLRNRIVNTPIARDPPRLNGIVVAWHVEFRIERHVEELRNLRSRRLNLAQFVRAARKEFGFSSIPIPVERKFGMRHAIGRPANLGVLPAPAAVGGYLHLANGPATGPGQAANLVESAAGQLLSPGRKGEDRLRSDLVSERRVFRVLTKMPVLVVVDVVLVHHLDSPQILRVEDAFEAGNHQPQRKTLLGTHRLAVHAVAHNAVIHGLGHRNARRALHFLVPFGNDPRRPAFHAGLLEQHREEDTGPFGTTAQPVRFLNCLCPGRRTVPRALDEMKAGDGREAHQVLHGEGERTVYHPMDHETMLPGIDVWNEGATGGRHVVERGWRDHSHLILKRSRDMKREPEFIGRRPTADWVRHPFRGHETGALAIGDQFLACLDELFRLWCLAVSWWLARRGSYGSERQTTGQRGAALEESPSIRLHASLLRR